MGLRLSKTKQSSWKSTTLVYGNWNIQLRQRFQWAVTELASPKTYRLVIIARLSLTTSVNVNDDSIEKDLLMSLCD